MLTAPRRNGTRLMGELSEIAWLVIYGLAVFTAIAIPVVFAWMLHNSAMTRIAILEKDVVAVKSDLADIKSNVAHLAERQTEILTEVKEGRKDFRDYILKDRP